MIMRNFHLVDTRAGAPVPESAQYSSAAAGTRMRFIPIDGSSDAHRPNGNWFHARERPVPARRH